MTTNAFIGLAFLLGFFLSVDANYWLLRDKNISKICVASQLDRGHTYAISWHLGKSDGKNKVKITNTSNQIITSIRTGNTLTSTIVLKNVTRFEDNLYHIDCYLVTDGKEDHVALYYLEFVPLRNKNMPNVAITVQKSNVEYGEEIKLNCTVRGNLITEKLDIEWRKDGKVVKNSSQSFYGEEVNLPLIIKSAEGSSGGMYICRATKDSNSVLFQANDTVSVVVFPKLIEPKKKVDHYFSIGDKVSVLCNIDGFPLSITWQKKSAKGILQNVSDGGHFQFKDNGKTLTIDKFQSGDATDFVCKSKDKNGTDIVQTITLTLKVDPTIRSDAVEKSVTLIPGQQFSLECDIHAVPLCITWRTYEPGKLMKSDVTDLTPGVVVPPTRCNGKTLRITNVTAFADGQIFSCSDGDVAQNISAVIMTKPHLYGPSSKEVKVEEGDDATLNCDIAVKPLNITWSVDGHTLSASNKRYMISSVDPHIVNIKDVDYDDRNSFFCSAKNVLDPKGVKQEIILRVKDPYAALWPAIGIVVAAVVVAVIIGVSWYVKKRRDTNNANAEQGTELHDGEAEHSQPLVSFVK